MWLQGSLLHWEQPGCCWNQSVITSRPRMSLTELPHKAGASCSKGLGRPSPPAPGLRREHRSARAERQTGTSYTQMPIAMPRNLFRAVSWSRKDTCDATGQRVYTCGLWLVAQLMCPGCTAEGQQPPAGFPQNILWSRGNHGWLLAPSHLGFC